MFLHVVQILDEFLPIGDIHLFLEPQHQQQQQDQQQQQLEQPIQQQTEQERLERGLPHQLEQELQPQLEQEQQPLESVSNMTGVDELGAVSEQVGIVEEGDGSNNGQPVFNRSNMTNNTEIVHVIVPDTWQRSLEYQAANETICKNFSVIIRNQVIVKSQIVLDYC